MKALVFYELGNVTMEKVREVYPRHKIIVDEFAKNKKIIAIGTFADPTEGSLGVFTDKASAEKFIKEDPFVTEGVIAKVTIKEWNEVLLK
jgi:uncharacterized protein